MYEAAASCKDIILSSVSNWETHCVTLAGYSYTERHGMKVQLVSSYRVSHLQRYGIVGTSRLIVHVLSSFVKHPNPFPNHAITHRIVTIHLTDLVMKLTS